MNIRREYLYKGLIILFLFFLVACGNRKAGSGEVIEQKPGKDRAIENFYISDTSGLQVAAISLGEQVQVYIGESYLNRDFRESSKCKYRNEDGTVIYQVKYQEGGFKIRDPADELLLKVKISDKKIKIGRDEEMTQSYEIKSTSPDKVKLTKGDTEIGVARMGQGALPVQIEGDIGMFYMAGPRKEPACIVMVLPDTDMMLRIVILSELLTWR